MNRVPCTSLARNVFARISSRSSALACVVALTASTFAQDAPLRYVRANDGGAKLYNLADKTSLSVGSVPAKTLLEVYDEKAGYLAVDAPAGMEVWVFGEYVRTTPLAGTVEITGANVLMRPMPKSDPSAYPLEMRLHKGDRVRVIGRNDPKKPLAEDWIKIVTPPGTRAWVPASETTPVDAKEDVTAAWNEAAKSGRAARPVFDVAAGAVVAGTATSGTATSGTGASGTTNAAASSDAAKAGSADAAGAAGAAGAQSEESFAAAEKLYEAAAKSPVADWVAVRTAYQRYLDKNPNGAMAEQAKHRIEQVGWHMEIESIRKDASLRDSQRAEKLADAERRLREANMSQDPLWGRFQARGYLIKEQPVASQPPRYIVMWAGKPTYEIVCSSGRYDLSVFDQFEVGVTGAILRSAVAETDTVAARPGRIDAARIEVLAARAKH
jgi:hypothetical protein